MSSNSEVVLAANHLSKAYRLYRRPQDRLLNTLFWRFGRQYGQVFWALQDVSFELHRGEMMGIVGRNGSGKSTLLQILAGTLQPTSGSLQLQGRISALLELGSGFNPELSGRENIYLNAAMLGLSHPQTEAKLEEIISFADIGDFIEQPVKLYSSGMFVRLAFSITTGLSPDILLVDEALSVGDIFFRQKCYRRLNELREQGTAILLVTHNLAEVEQFCSRAILLRHGKMIQQGSASEVVKHYYLQDQASRLPSASASDQAFTPFETPLPTSSESSFWPASTLNLDKIAQVSTGQALCRQVAVCDTYGKPTLSFSWGQTAVFYSEFELLAPLFAPIGGLVLQDSKGFIVHGKNTLHYDNTLPVALPAGSRVRFRQEITLRLQPGQYTFEVGLASMMPEKYQLRHSIPQTELRASLERICHLPGLGPLEILPAMPHGVPQLLHVGAADLPGSLETFILRP